jgi:uncharacterized protein (DUF1501 family)
MISRRRFITRFAHAGLAAASAPLWLHETSARAFAQLAGKYKAIVVVTLEGGNDGNNMVIPTDSSAYNEYASLRTSVALSQSSCIPLTSSQGSQSYALHPSLSNVASLYNSGNAIVVANVGPISRPVTKAQLAATPDLGPEALLSHPAGVAQWESASTVALPATGWGGRIGDIISSQSGSLPPVISAGLATTFTVGQSVQAVVVQANSTVLTPLPEGIDSAILSIATNDSTSQNQIVAQAAKLRVQAMNQQVLLAQAQNSGTPLQTQFPTTWFGAALQAIARVINGRSVVGASRQIFYCQQGSYDSHATQLGAHASLLSELDGGIGAFMNALQEMGLQNDVLLCTHSDFNRTFLSNTCAGTDHGWGNHQLVIGGGIKGGQIIGNIPEPEIGGSLDLTGGGIWIPDLSVTQMAAGVGKWMGLSDAQLGSVFPDLANFPTGSIVLT